ncbi:S-layer homology domain-containing protein [Aneurinibacillus sp. REN35]|uniref:S-layer homology domain-containing protein n=1 Tax=Aneurinibacillus sp. REN35 TaxID=3237286 RepID=UPI0035296208
MVKRYSARLASKLVLAAVFSASVLLPGQAFAELKEMDKINSYLPEDIKKHWAGDRMYDLLHADMMKGYVDRNGTTTVQPSKKITRAEFVSLLVGALSLKENPDQDIKAFSDVEPGDWYHKPISIASSFGIVKGVSDTSFGPNRYITRGEIAAFISRAFAYTIEFDETKGKNFTDVKSSYWAIREIKKTSSVKIINGYPNGAFKPFEYATRAEAMVMLSNSLYLEENAVPTDKVLSDMVKQYEEEEGKALKATDMERMRDAAYTNSIGYHKATRDVTAAVLRKLKEDGYSIEVTREGDLNAKVIGKWNRLAVVEVDGVEYRIKASKEGSADLINTQKIDGIFMLKKNVSNNKWQVYSSDIPMLVTDKMISAVKNK